MEYRRSSLGKHSENTISEISTISTISENMQLEKSMLQLNIERKRLHNVMRFSDFEIIWSRWSIGLFNISITFSCSLTSVSRKKALVFKEDFVLTTL